MLRRNGLRGDGWDLLSLESPASPNPWDWDPQGISVWEVQGFTEIPVWGAHGSMEIPVWDAQESAEIPLWDAHGSMEIPVWDAHGSMEIPLWDEHGSMEIPLWDVQGSPRTVSNSTTSSVQGSMVGSSWESFSRFSRQVSVAQSSSWGSGKESAGQSSTVRMDFWSGNFIVHIPGVSKVKGSSPELGIFTGSTQGPESPRGT